MATDDDELLHCSKELTANEDLHLTEVCIFSDRELHDDVSVRWHVAGTLQFDGGPDSNNALVLTADGVVPKSRGRDSGRDVGQTDDEIVRSLGTFCNQYYFDNYRAQAAISMMLM